MLKIQLCITEKKKKNLNIFKYTTVLLNCNDITGLTVFLNNKCNLGDHERIVIIPILSLVMYV